LPLYEKAFLWHNLYQSGVFAFDIVKLKEDYAVLHVFEGEVKGIESGGVE
jgi:hypothetical protein